MGSKEVRLAIHIRLTWRRVNLEFQLTFPPWMPCCKKKHMACLVVVFKNWLTTKTLKTYLWKGMCFCFLYFLCFQKPFFFRTIKRCFHFFFHYSKNKLFSVFYLPFFCVSLTTFCVSTKVSFTQPPYPHP